MKKNKENYLEYVNDELCNINNDISNETLEKIENTDNLKVLFNLVSNINNICSSKIESYWLWSKNKK